MTLLVSIPAALFISANARLHWAEKARRTKDIRAHIDQEAA